ncbi:APC family permease [Frondihabitans cladoniiphilus]|uniref:APC family permease n=1 Tax=Frondihabitans cladoniiphilus TaxID=715785 RepID=A0ABP8VHQ2_9MICO
MTDTKLPEMSPVTAGAEGDPFKLRGKMGTLGLMFTVLAFVGPLVAAFGYISFDLSFNVAAPLAFVIAALVILLFALGFTRMTRFVPRAGGFYTYIAEGLGKPLGLGGAFVALYTYLFALISSYAFSATALNNFLGTIFHLSALPWWICALIMWAVVSVVSYFNIEVSAKLLLVLMACEMVIIIVFDAVVLAKGGPEGLSSTPWSFGQLGHGSTGLLFLFAIGLFVGFEATVVYRDEVKNPEKTVPRATYGAIIFLGVFYAITCYALVTAHGASKAVADATSNPAGMFGISLNAYLGKVTGDIVSVLLVTSILALILSGQNILARYTHSLGVDGVFPRAVGVTHPKHGSPSRASMVVSAIFLVVIVGAALTRVDSVALYGAVSSLGFYGLLLMLVLVSIAVIVYFRRHPEHPVGIWTTVVAPVIATLAIGTCLVIASMNLSLLVAGSTALAAVLIGLCFFVLALGIVLAAIYKRTRPETYARIGRSID